MDINHVISIFLMKGTMGSTLRSYHAWLHNMPDDNEIRSKELWLWIGPSNAKAVFKSTVDFLLCMVDLSIHSKKNSILLKALFRIYTLAQYRHHSTAHAIS